MTDKNHPPENVALVYDFDGTLAPGNMQEKTFFPQMSVKSEEFWAETKAMAKKNDMDEILAYQKLMLDMARERKVDITPEAFEEFGRGITFFPGVTEWFDRINDFSEQLNLKLSHYIISSGLEEMINGTQIRKYFKKIYASGFIYNENNCAVWPARAINYTVKTQYLFRINKGIENSWDNERINKYLKEEDRPLPFSRMLYFGDGETDIPAMKMLNYQGGYSIAVYPPNQRRVPTKDELKRQKNARTLLKEGRTKYCVAADYTENSHLDLLVKSILSMINSQAVALKLSLEN